jgi:hypothetical protein
MIIVVYLWFIFDTVAISIAANMQIYVIMRSSKKPGC